MSRRLTSRRSEERGGGHPCALPSCGVVGAYRLMAGSGARHGIGFYGASEYDLGLLERYPRETLELGRSCVDREHRGGAARHLLWTGLGEYVTSHDVSKIGRAHVCTP